MDEVPADAFYGVVPTLGRNGDFLCSVCGYGIVARWGLPERCPMCGAFSWAPARSSHHGEAVAGIGVGATRSAAVRLAPAETAEAGLVETRRAA